MSIASFFTLQVQTPGQTRSAGHQALGTTPGVNALGFLDFLLTQLDQSKNGSPAAGAGEKKEQTALQSDNPLLEQDPKLDLARLLAATPEVAQQVEDLPEGSETDLAQILALNNKAFEEILKPFLNNDGTITVNGKAIKLSDSNKPVLIAHSFLLSGENSNRPALLKLRDLLDKISSGHDDTGAKPLIVTNLTPDQIAALKQKIDEILASKNAEDSQDDATSAALNQILICLVHVVPPPAPAANPAATGGTPNPADTTTTTDATGKDGAPQQQPTLASLSSSTGADLSSQDGQDESFKALSGVGNNKNESGTAQTPAKDTSTIKPDVAATLQDWKFFTNYGLGVPALSMDDMMQNLGYTEQGAPITGTGKFINPVMQSSQASLPIPATQLVAATIQKMASDGENKNFRVQLEPPELGRIEVRMSFDKDNKTVKAVLLSEKPETMAMLQRDAHSLERALTNAGLDAAGSSLSFEMAGEGYDFNGQGGGSGQSGGNGEQLAGDVETIESSVTWYVDPQTGHTRYNLTA